MPPYHITFEGHCLPTSTNSMPAPGATVTRNEVLPFLAPTACRVLWPLPFLSPALWGPERASQKMSVKFGARCADVTRAHCVRQWARDASTRRALNPEKCLCTKPTFCVFISENSKNPYRLQLFVGDATRAQCLRQWARDASTRRALNPENVFFTKPTFCVLSFENTKNPYRLQLFIGVARIVIRKQNP